MTPKFTIETRPRLTCPNCAADWDGPPCECGHDPSADPGYDPNVYLLLKDGKELQRFAHEWEALRARDIADPETEATITRATS